MDIKTLLINDKAVSYRESGKGEAIICLHGWAGDNSIFTNLSKELSGYHLIAPDLPNFGRSDSTSDVQNLDEYAEFLQTFLQKLDIKDYSLLGYSMGGQILVHGCGKKILRPNKLILVAASGLRNGAKNRKKALRFAAKILKLITPPSYKNKFYKKIGLDYRTDLSPIHKKILKNLVQTDVADKAQKLSMPVLLIYGQDDTSTPPEHGKRFAEIISNSELIVIDNEDHWMLDSSGEKIANHIKGFLE